MSVYSWCQSSLSLTAAEVFAAQTVSCILLSAFALLVSLVCLTLYARLPPVDSARGNWWQRLFSVFMYKFIPGAGSVSVAQFRRVFLLLAAAAGVFEGTAWILFWMVHKFRFDVNNENSTLAIAGDDETVRCRLLCHVACARVSP
jgi:hypothetical protein